MAATLSQNLLLAVPLAPLVGALVAGLAGKAVGRRGAHTVTILGVLISFICSAIVLKAVAMDGARFAGTIYEWAVVGGLRMEVGFLVDGLTAMMMCVVTFVSLMVHVYTIGYMEEDPGYQRFFSYISLFTFSMLMLVMSNNFLQLFFGWEAVGLVSYLLIGFWFKKPSATFANMKAFLVNRVGDFGFILGIGLIVAYAGTLDYAEAFAKGPELAALSFPGQDWMLITVICICLFIGAMGKSAQFPLHVWLPDSMEGPTPISALIHAATMVTAGIFMVARMSPLFELSDTALNFVLVIGSITALFMGFLGIIQNDIKRVVAYSTLSQLGYMTVALGVSAYSVAVFHLMTHAFFKALLFLAAGSVIIGMHHDQDIRNMGGLRKYMPITWITALLGSLALIGTPLFSGFYSKDSIIEAVHASTLPGAGFALFAVTAGVFVTAFYSFRMYFLVFHGEERFRHKPFPPEDDHAHGDDHGHGHDATPHESPWVVTAPLLLLALPSVVIGFMTIGPMLYGDFFAGAIFVDAAKHPAMAELAEKWHGATAMALHGLQTAPFWLALAGVVTAWVFYLKAPQIPAALDRTLKPLRTVLENKYYMDWFNEHVLAAGARLLGTGLWKGGDVGLIDGAIVNGSAKTVGLLAGVLRRVQTGHLYWYALVMLLGIFGFMTWRLWPFLGGLTG
ncbi:MULTISPECIES: NADH-quinone oxidoreductase subunit L [unclassified Rubrivivax]|uniref:NADH-quinone oxidoreductase subunit L n=1 Tax=unclassified Rubrivivax TaxID=2649762 RepID=UPI001E505036|nr:MULTISPECIES: NADH-quinone oxidoreductase subunit L [unclassified Rubrivivax]MCC9596061.1 NADH-quinone oxidoreductase subunit L [Rubrivivax sp. JA1055]MCC9647598.1 NADH-quinone oxidoreductase subunit L [Rubrivivax sp. JA1029]